ncbi:MAG: nucleotide exchange factor GrpE [Bacteroidia bacterium]|jgi:molecular chaperone GrpE|nr:nucleotide exchange factor GrpE [Bacteroidia bacterium]
MQDELKKEGEDSTTKATASDENTTENHEQTIVNEQDSQEEMSEVDELKQEVGELKDKYIRLYSEFDNYKKRTTKERIELFKTAGQDILTSLLPIIDDFERTMKSTETSEDLKAIKEGISLVYNKFNNTLEQQGLKAFSAINQVFDADIHEAITNIPAPNAKMKGKVLDEVEKGYKLHDKVIRFAKVVVGE